MMIQIPKHPSSNIARVEALFQFLNLYNAAIYEVKFKFGGEVDDMGGGGAPEPVATFSPFNIQGNFDHSQLYVFTREGWDKPGVKSFGGYIFLMKTRALDPLIPSTVQFQQYGTLVSAYGILYFLESRKPFIQGRGDHSIRLVFSRHTLCLPPLLLNAKLTDIRPYLVHHRDGYWIMGSQDPPVADKANVTEASVRGLDVHV
ncbi:unnamed protein product [Prunus armeniaca]|uniref:Uncharacterized protein n=1 Tax=Prunus armeniaca TaxID=36596 RepID=A0A6J5UDR5_PRUAR|nr:unnamed protein product [Prunus armeniaca]